MYYKFETLCREHQVTPSLVGREAGINQSTLANWKARTAMAKELGQPLPGISVANLKKLADYFGVSLDYFMED